MNLTLMLAVQLLVLLLVANGMPLLATRLFGNRWAWPVDGGRQFLDGKPLLGSSKTWRGVVLAMAGCALTAALFGFSWQFGLTFGAAAMLGDSLSSFTKRRLSIASGGRALGIDQIPEALVPLLACQHVLALDGGSILLLTLVFAASGVVISRALFALGLRDKPY